MEAALQNPHAIVQFSSDGIVSLKPLDLDIGTELGQWEHKLIKEGLYLHSGVYSYLEVENDKDTTKTRGMNPDYSKEDDDEDHEPEAMTVEFETAERKEAPDFEDQPSHGLAGPRGADWRAGPMEDRLHGPEVKKEPTMRDLLLQKALPAWREISDPDHAASWPEISFMQRIFVTAGSSVAGAERFKRWTKKPRYVKVHEAGLKRRLVEWLPELYYSTPIIEDGIMVGATEAKRCSELVETMPAHNLPNAYWIPSTPNYPEWLENDGEIIFEKVFADDDEVCETDSLVEAM
jgi:hypothetical protein